MTGAAALPPPFRLVALDEVDSTNAEARRRAAAGAPDGTVIAARRQSAGRGRRGRRWESPEGNLYMTLLLRPGEPVEEAARFSFVAAVAAGDALAELAPPGAAVAHKWPNDVLVNGGKCAGVLLESSVAARSAGGRSRLDWLAVGVGANLSRHPADTPYRATDLASEGAPGIAPGAAMAIFLRRFQHWREAWRARGFAAVRRAWLARAAGVGGPVEARTGKEVLHGVFAGLAEDGALLLESGGAVRRVSAGDVFPPGA